MNKQYINMISKFMLEKKLSQAEMAQRLEITPTTLSRWLSGKHGITPKNKNLIEFVCGKPRAEITNKIFGKVEKLAIEEQWEVYEHIVKNYK